LEEEAMIATLVHLVQEKQRAEAAASKGEKFFAEDEEYLGARGPIQLSG
jgi:hypothetical protein